MSEKIGITRDRRAERELATRVEKLKSNGPPVTLDPETRSIHFLRGACSRATLLLPEFYLFIGSRVKDDNCCSIAGFPGVAFKHATEFSSINTVSLVCRKLFDQKVKGLTGANFAKSSDETLKKVAKHWCQQSGKSQKEALAALNFLKIIFRDCAKGQNQLLAQDDMLRRRIGLIKQHADRRAAHISLDSFAFTVLDCAHVVAAIVVIGEIIRSFDGPSPNPNYFDLLDHASLEAATHLFPDMPSLRLLEQIDINAFAKQCWQSKIKLGRQMMFNELSYATGWF
jgi:hypothetical protein